MAEAILFNLTADIIFKLGSLALQEIGFQWGVKDDLEKLKGTLSAIQAVLHDAEEQQSKNTCVKDWVLKLKDVLYEIDDLIEESSYEALRRQVLAKDRRNRKQVRILYSKFISNRKIGHKIKEIRQRIQAINDEKNQFNFSERVIQKRDDDELRKKRRETYSYINEGEVLGRNDDKEAVINLLLNSNTTENIAVISIVGMGGLGKTALAQSIYTHDNMINNGFELKLWVCVSEEFDLNMIIQKILESATGKKPESFLQLDLLQSKLREKIDGKKYLLVMDDVWNEKKQEWLRLKRLLMGGAKGSRILITARSEQVAKTFDTTSSDIHYLQYLDEQNSWLLFQKMTGLEGLDQNSNLIKIGKEIMLRLKGVPLSIRTIGGLLKDNKSERFWLSFKDKELYQVLGQGQDDLKEMQSILELSYKYLSAHLKQCFLYCALFPKDYVMKKDKLIRLWRAQGFIQPNDNSDNNLIDIGDDYFMELLSRSFFQEVTKNDLGDITRCKMHDLMHDLACSITDNECVFGQLKNINKRTRHISLEDYCHDHNDQLMGALSKATQLRTFFMPDDIASIWQLGLLEKNIHYFFRLRTLKLNLSGNAKLLKFIGRLKYLRYLSIRDLRIKHLPDSIMKLYNLEVFIIKSNELEKLPSDIKNLINLKHLEISNADLEFLPDSITKLGKLEALILKNCTKLKGLPEDVKNWINLRELDLSENRKIEFLPNSISQLNNLETLILGGCANLKELPKDTKRLINLKHLDLYECWALTHMPKGLGELTNLQKMNRFVLGKSKGGELNELDGLTKLKGTLEIIVNLEYCISTLDRQTKGKFLQQKSGLEKLVLHFINSYDKFTIVELDDVIYESVLDCLQPHSNLQEIFIENYRGVKLCDWVSSNFLGCLVSIYLLHCERLQHLPRFDQFPNLKHLVLIGLPNIEYIIVNNDDSVSPSTFFPSLKRLHIFDMPKLKRWWKGTTSTESPIIFSCLFELHINCCPLQFLKFFHAPNLEALKIGGSEVEVDELDVVPRNFFGNLTFLDLFNLRKLEYLPECWEQYMTHLQYLTLFNCENLKSLPKWIQHIKGLKSLHIYICPMLKERCKKDIGEDWPKIAHIPNRDIE